MHTIKRWSLNVRSDEPTRATLHATLEGALGNRAGAKDVRFGRRRREGSSQAAYPQEFLTAFPEVRIVSPILRHQGSASEDRSP
jgi:hypothetical protein